MKKKLLPHPLHFLVSLASIHETIVVFAIQGLVSSPISSSISASMAAFSSGIQLGSEGNKRMDPPKKMKTSSKSSKNGAKRSDGEKGNGLAPFLGKFKSTRTVSKEGYASFMDYKILEKATNKFHPGPSHGSSLTWHRRLKIALNTARGLEYLHEHCNLPVIHRDLKSSNILLDLNFNAKLSDFGLAVTDAAQSKNNLKLSGTLGYVVPDYLLNGKLTDKSDVYAFGVVLLELLLGRKPVKKLASSRCQSIVTWATPQVTDRSKLPNIVDPVIRDTMDLKHLYQVAAVAVLCVQPEPSYRPFITDVLHSLIPLVPVDLGGTLRVTQPTAP